MDQLNTEGYILFKNILSIDVINKGCSYIDDQRMDYNGMRNFIEQNMLKALNTKLNTSLIYTKYRVSNNNNSIDAGAFHRDIMPIHNNSPVVPIYTCLCYLDKTVMEIIPGTHKTIVMSYTDAIRTYSAKKSIVIEPSDLLIINSLLIHRGIFTEGLQSRRLIQVFNCYKNREDFDTYMPMIIDTPGDDKHQDLFLRIYKNYVTSMIPNIFGYLNAATGGGVRGSETIANCPIDLSKYLYYSSEGLCKRVTVVPNTLQQINLYAIVIPKKTLDDSCRADYMYKRYNKQFYIYSTILFALFAILLTLIVKLILYVRVKLFSNVKRSRSSLRSRR